MRAKNNQTWSISCLNSVIDWFKYARTLIGGAMVSLFRSTTWTFTITSADRSETQRETNTWSYLFADFSYSCPKVTFFFFYTPVLHVNSKKSRGALTSRFVRLENLLWSPGLQQQVEHVRRLDTSEENSHRSVFLTFVRSLQVLMKLIILHQATAVQRDNTFQLH